MRNKILVGTAALVLAAASMVLPANARGWHHHWHHGGGAAFGFAAGALLGGALAAQGPYYYGDPYGYDGYAYSPPVYEGGNTEAYCESRFKSYDPASGTYLGYDGDRHPCP